jgi:hypothetical protein
MLGNSLVVERLVASQEGLNSVELFGCSHLNSQFFPNSYLKLKRRSCKAVI